MDPCIHPTTHFRAFTSPPKEAPISRPSPSPWQPLTHFPSLWTGLCWTFPISRITHCLSMSASLIVTACVLKVHSCWRESQGFLLFQADESPSMERPHFVFVHELVNGHFGGLHFGVVGVQVLCKCRFTGLRHVGMESLGPHGWSHLMFQGTTVLFSSAAALFHIPSSPV